MHYLFQPLMEDGKQVVRIPKNGDVFLNGNNEIYESYSSDMWTTERPILTMKRFEEDPFQPIREFYEAHKNEDMSLSLYSETEEMWQAIVATMEKLEGMKQSIFQK